MPVKKCPKCNNIKNTLLFRKDSTRKDGLGSMCKDCKKSTEKAWRKKNITKIRRKQNIFYEENKEVIKKKRRENYSYLKSKARYLAKSIKEKPCVICGKGAERHHKNYNEPLNVVFLCKSHHKQVHDGTLSLAYESTPTQSTL